MALAPMGGGGRGMGFGRGWREADIEIPSLRITNRRMLAWFYHDLKPHWPKILFAVIAMVGGTLAGLYIPLVLRRIFDEVITNGRKDLLPVVAMQFLVLTVLSQGLGAARTTLMHLLGQRFVFDVRMQCYRHLMKLGMRYFHRQRSGDVMSRISNDVGAIEEMVVHGSDDIITNGVHVIGAVGFLFYLNWKMALVALAPLPIFLGSIWVFSIFIRPIFNQIRRELGEINARLQERIAGIQVIKAFAREDPETAFFEESSRAYWRMSAKSIWLWSTFFPGLSILTSIGLVILIWYGASGAAGSMAGGIGEGIGKITGGTIVAFIMYMQQFYRPVGTLARVQNTLNRCLASIARIFELLDEQPDVRDKPGAIALGRVSGRVDIEEVSFRYAATGEMVLQNVSVTALPGETIAIVGRSGAGKSSLVNLIPRFYDPQDGRILVDGHDIRDVTQQSLRANIGMVLQDTFLFNTTIKENIRYARAEAGDGDVVRAAQGARAHDFIMSFDKGYDTLIGERGVRLSGGERQRIAIARAILADPRILILDEATSMIDTEAEQMIQAALARLMEGRTSFIIAHRLSTVRRANKIVVIDNGQVVEADRHEALMARRGLYAEMVNRQISMDTDYDFGQGPEVTGLGV